MPFVPIVATAAFDELHAPFIGVPVYAVDVAPLQSGFVPGVNVTGPVASTFIAVADAHPPKVSV